MEPKKIQIIVGSVRPGRIGYQVAEWLKLRLDKQADIKTEIIDLKEINLPFMDEPTHPSMNQYTKDYTKAWSKKIKEGSGYVWLTAEYNAGYTASIKNAIDYLYHEWQGKPVLVASYGVDGGKTANHQLVEVATRLKMQVAEPRVEIPIKNEMRGEDGLLKNVGADFVDYEANTDQALKALTQLVQI